MVLPKWRDKTVNEFNSENSFNESAFGLECYDTNNWELWGVGKCHKEIQEKQVPGAEGWQREDCE